MSCSFQWSVIHSINVVPITTANKSEGNTMRIHITDGRHHADFDTDNITGITITDLPKFSDRDGEGIITTTAEKAVFINVSDGGMEPPHIHVTEFSTLTCLECGQPVDPNEPRRYRVQTN